MANQLGPVSGFILDAEKEPVLFIAGDTVWHKDVNEAIIRYCSDVIILYAGAASSSCIWRLTNLYSKRWGDDLFIMAALMMNPELLPIAFDDAINGQNLERVIALYTEDASMRTQFDELLTGTDAIVSGISRMFLAKPYLKNTVKRSIIAGDIALLIVDWVMELTDSTGQRFTTTGTATNVAKQMADGSWRLHVTNPLGIM
ncbi:YybH family protein [Paenibacillus hexagrammi]|uniref:Nuclear transport factor 2 family protein n=1 Tax=Paenibacillus hexagrammi TaxID=2908839 RepID=A0ABY3SK72_9BACL|nr:nuclear transport factor 2 family protein [Paenibacillus sp. YPD9-1]UJF33780.1 nuclear transport factor 2 family protein [Paenibacillus sp. YPD9-1]